MINYQQLIKICIFIAKKFKLQMNKENKLEMTI